MSATKEKINDKIEQGMRKQSFFNKFYCKLLTAFLFFISYFKKKKKKKLIKIKEGGQPYVIQVENNTSKAVHDVDLFDSYDMLSRDVFDKNGDYDKDGLKISSCVQYLSYKEVLYQISVNKVKVIFTYIQSINEKQVLQRLIVIKKTVYYGLYGNVMSIINYPRQQQIGISAITNDYEIDGLTTLLIPIIKPKTKVTYHFHLEPMAIRNLQ